ncbi:class I glutamine amidotransferase-like protein [Lojkania enalia]|uniref:Class I glutamine amidotransferase-like protein n=1 Tax=Lojkania enalia TaxID=147567 RepID=A0A9P4K9K3_9PLEO|nr:class I glutamine amidotransferase-like protein [Didymosphaeria enalia]
MAAQKKPLRVGLLYENAQMTDLAGVDILGNISTKNVELIVTMMPEFASYVPLSVPMEFLWISSSTDPASMTSSMLIKPTHTYSDAPRDLDIIMIAGPDPRAVHPESLQFLKEAAKQTKWILTTCTGGMWLAASGVLDGRKATTNRTLLKSSKEVFPKVEWLDQRWVIEKGEFEGAEIWTAGGAGCGIDMIAEFARKNFDNKLVEVALYGLDFHPEGPHGQFYTGPLPTF